MGKLTIFIIILFLAALAVFAIYNQGVTTVKIPFGEVYETPTIALVLLSIAVGSFAMLFYFMVRDTKKYLDSLQYQKRQKKEAKLQGLYSKAINYLRSHHNQQEAKELLNEVLSVEPEHINALLQLGDIAVSEEDFQKAREYYQKAWNLNPQSLDALFALERLMEKTGRWQDTLRYIEEILEIDDKNLLAMYIFFKNLICGMTLFLFRRQYLRMNIRKRAKAVRDRILLDINMNMAGIVLKTESLRKQKRHSGQF
jgi:tetratricopeptide (TPR) repeat protein